MGVRSAPTDLRQRLARVIGTAAPLLFVAVFLVEGWLRPGYDPRSRFVSELSLGPRGWVQVTSFLVTGTLLVVFARAAAPYLRGGRAGAALPALLQVVGLALAASGPFVTDSSAPSVPSTAHGLVHGVLGAVVFSLAPVCCGLAFVRFRREPGRRLLARWSLAAAVTLTVGIVVLKVAQQPDEALSAWKGLVQRVVLVTFMAWLATLASAVGSGRRAGTTPSTRRPRPPHG